MGGRQTSGGGAIAAPAGTQPPGEGPRATDERKVRRAEKRSVILAGAAQVFAEKGFFNSTVAEIARAARVADGTIYLYFKSKDDLLLSVFEEQMGTLVKQARAAVGESASAGEALERVARLHLRAVEEHPAMASVLIVEMRQSNAFVRRPRKPVLDEYLDLMGDIVRRGQAAGEFDPALHPGAVKRALFGAMDEIALSWLLATHKFDLRATAAQVSAMFVRGLARPPAPVRPAPGTQQAPADGAVPPAAAAQTTGATERSGGGE